MITISHLHIIFTAFERIINHNICVLKPNVDIQEPAIYSILTLLELHPYYNEEASLNQLIYTHIKSTCICANTAKATCMHSLKLNRRYSYYAPALSTSIEQ